MPAVAPPCVASQLTSRPYLPDVVIIKTNLLLLMVVMDAYTSSVHNRYLVPNAAWAINHPPKAHCRTSVAHLSPLEATSMTISFLATTSLSVPDLLAKYL